MSTPEWNDVLEGELEEVLIKLKLLQKKKDEWFRAAMTELKDFLKPFCDDRDAESNSHSFAQGILSNPTKMMEILDRYTGRKSS